ncbi:glucose-6-phosphate dehydrogenase assembly protein OpcA [Actinopolymorpha alba]|uniref:glucose-6-phosphate dehydrogenase assembly protein OpcA n=1 Tax=Actinopolymorpha alba TaxID=533267 RepID=UPI00037D85E2|nr:glucose-6-phosphate dehydrogenase assembly protein OpcA [Actinopolymorpha alba]
MIIDLSDTTASEIAAALVRARRSAGSPAMGMVLTLIVVADESTHYDALKAAMQAAKEHPSRILGVIPRAGRGAPRLDAEVRVGGEGGGGESVLLRLYGELSKHAESVVMPLLLPESPVVAWWPGKAPDEPSADPLGQLSQRRVTDAASDRRPLTALQSHCHRYAPGDTDLSWTRTTPWRALLAAALDQYPVPVQSATVEAERANASADLIAAWLSRKLRIPATVKASKGPGITATRLHTESGDIAITRPDGLLARYSIPGQPERNVALKRRDTSELLAEELRRLDPDDVYAQTVEELLRKLERESGQRRARTPTRSTSAETTTAKAAASSTGGSTTKSTAEPGGRSSVKSSGKATKAAAGSAGRSSARKPAAKRGRA